MNGTQNMNGHNVTVTNGTIYVPAQTEYATLDSNAGTKFRAQITQSGQFLIVSATGWSNHTATPFAVQVKYQKAPKASAIFNYGVAAPLFPWIDASSYAQYATNLWTKGTGSFSNQILNNVTLPPGNYSFGSNTTIQGVLLIQAPANVTISGNATVQGTVVVANNP